MPNGLCGGEKGLRMGALVLMTPAQLNEVILEKLSLLAPRLETLRDALLQFQRDLSNGAIRWNAILERNEKAL